MISEPLFKKKMSILTRFFGHFIPPVISSCYQITHLYSHASA